MKQNKADAPAIPLARWADRQLRMLAAETGSQRIADLSGDMLLGERGSNGNYTINGTTSAGLGGSRLLATRDKGWFALSLIRDADRELIPALFGDSAVDGRDWQAIAEAAKQHDCRELLARGRDLGLPVASADEQPACPAIEVLTRGSRRERNPAHRPLVIDLSAIWAGPLAGHLLWLAGADVVKVESLSRPDLIHPPWITASKWPRSSSRETSARTSPCTTSRSASLPTSTVPISLWRPMISAPIRVAETRASMGVKPTSFTKKLISLA